MGSLWTYSVSLSSHGPLSHSRMARYPTGIMLMNIFSKALVWCLSIMMCILPTVRLVVIVTQDVLASPIISSGAIQDVSSVAENFRPRYTCKVSFGSFWPLGCMPLGPFSFLGSHQRCFAKGKTYFRLENSTLEIKGFMTKIEFDRCRWGHPLAAYRILQKYFETPRKQGVKFLVLQDVPSGIPTKRQSPKDTIQGAFACLVTCS